ncbi:MAG: sugar-transfer associated ATP-grasp domain-containing protein [Roseovarius sp.]|nr:sugar-transfer associated ATP-grasp domain-containing protein [Roseovarius sp.]
MAFDYLKLRRRRGKLRFYEYLLYGLYDKTRWSEPERDEFLSAHIHWPIVNECNDAAWWAVTEDKWLSSVFLEHNGMPVPKSMAVYDHSPRVYPDLAKLSGQQDLRDFLTGCDAFPLFAKPIGGIWSAGALRIAGCTDTHVILDGRDPVTFEELAGQVLGTQAYFIQTCLKPHRFFDGLTKATATVRSLNLIGKDGLTVPYTVLKLPHGANVADDFWRPGNLLCNLDPQTGEVLNIVVNQNGQRVELDALPEAERALLGERLPCWDALRSLNERVALLHGVNRYGSTDIALTEDGPVVVEVNNSCAFELIQMATGRGILTPQMAEFFGDCGVKI